jgi:tyrosinase
MRTDIALNGSNSPTANYIGWSPRPAEIRLREPGNASSPVRVTLKNQRPNVGGQVLFSTAANVIGTDTLQLDLPTNGNPVRFFVGGKFQSPSVRDKDAAIEVRGPNNAVLGIEQLMVRVRKDASTLTNQERDRFIAAFATLNGRGLGRFNQFRDMHREETLEESHGNDGFLPWHRAYLLDLERELQNIDASVTLPYWRFDKPAPSIFTREFLGTAGPNGTVQFAANNPLQFWRSDQGSGVTRTPLFNVATSGARSPAGPVRTEAATLNLGTNYGQFVVMEGQPHGRAHTSFQGFINNPDTAPKDPLFFLLHTNVDRLWAMWQWLNRRIDPAIAGTYRFLTAGATRIGHNLPDTMWPWNNNTTDPRPSTAPGGTLARAAHAAAPTPSPAVREMLDWQGKLNPAAWLGFDYDDVPFEP